MFLLIINSAELVVAGCLHNACGNTEKFYDFYVCKNCEWYESLHLYSTSCTCDGRYVKNKICVQCGSGSIGCNEKSIDCGICQKCVDPNPKKCKGFTGTAWDNSQCCYGGSATASGSTGFTGAHNDDRFLCSSGGWYTCDENCISGDPGCSQWQNYFPNLYRKNRCNVVGSYYCDGDGVSWVSGNGYRDPCGTNKICDGAGNCVDDKDSDGYNVNIDCNDNNAAINPGAAEICNDNIDNNCNGAIDCADTASCLSGTSCDACTGTAPLSCSSLSLPCDQTGCYSGWCGFIMPNQCCLGTPTACTSITNQADCKGTCSWTLGKCYGGVCDTQAPTKVSVVGTAALDKKNLTVSVNCSDTDCNANSYKLKIYAENPATCPTNYDDYNETSPKNVIGPAWACGAAKDNAGNARFSSVYEVDSIPPNIELFTISPENPKVQDEITISARAADSGIGMDKIKIYVDNNVVQTCTATSDCTAKITYGYARNHISYVKAYDLVGNVNMSNIKRFLVSGSMSLNCVENTNNTGILCDEGYYCLPPGIFVNSKDGGEGTNEGTQNPDGARCCSSGTCTSVYTLPNCEGEPTYGTQFDPAIAQCIGEEVLANVENLELKCCVGDVSILDIIKTGGLDVYWSRQTSGFFKLTEAAEGDSLYCVATGIESADFTINKPKKEETGSASAGTDGIATLKTMADETGTYKCKAKSGTDTKTESIKISQSGKDPTKLPFFGIVQFVISLIIIIIYCVYRKK